MACLVATCVFFAAPATLAGIRDRVKQKRPFGFRLEVEAVDEPGE
jgi:hypothetical protein